MQWPTQYVARFPTKYVARFLTPYVARFLMQSRFPDRVTWSQRFTFFSYCLWPFVAIEFEPRGGDNGFARFFTLVEEGTKKTAMPEPAYR